MEFPSRTSVRQLLCYTYLSLPFHSDARLGSVTGAVLLTLVFGQGQKTLPWIFLAVFLHCFLILLPVALCFEISGGIWGFPQRLAALMR